MSADPRSDLRAAATLLRVFAGTSLESGAVAEVLALAGRLEAADPPRATREAIAQEATIEARTGRTGKGLARARAQAFGDGTTLSQTERELITEGLHYLEENGAPGMSWRGGTRRMESAVEGIARKLDL
jgi:hypothetical protein